MSNENISNNAVEVVATFGDAVVGVRHLTDPRGGVVTKMTKALLAGGAALLATSAIAFGWAASVAAENKAGLEAWEAQGKPAWAYRPQMLPRSLDVLTLGGSILGLGALAWGLSRRKSEQHPAHVRLGTAAGCDFAMEGVGSSFDLVAPAGDGFAVNVAPGMLGAPAGSVPVSPTTRLRLSLGATTFHIQSVAAPKRHAAGLTFDRRAAGFFAASAAAHLAIIALLGTVPSELDSASGDDANSEVIAVIGDSNSAEEKPLPPSEEHGDEDGMNDSPRTAMALVEGQMGSNEPGATGKRQVKERSDRPAISKAEAIARAKEAGLFTSDHMRGGFASITGTGDITSGMDDVDIYGGWEGDGTGSPEGFGNGRKGFGPGGGGKDWNSIWSGDYNTIPGDGNDGSQYSFEDPSRRQRKHLKTVPDVKMCKTSECQVSGDVDAAVIRRYIKRNASKISYCYEKQLLSTPGLSGTVSTKFTVTPDGVVSSSTASGVHENVSSCIAGVIAKIKFPAFKAPFEVKYPFHVRPAGA